MQAIVLFSNKQKCKRFHTIIQHHVDNTMISVVSVVFTCLTATTVSNLRLKMTLNGVTVGAMKNQTVKDKVAASFAAYFKVWTSQINITVVASTHSRRALAGAR